MPCVRVRVFFKPLNSTEKSDDSIINHGDTIGRTSEFFQFKDNQETTEFYLDNTFYREFPEKEEGYELIALPVVKGVASRTNGAIITFGQEAPYIRNDLLPRVIHGIFEAIKPSNDQRKHSVKLSMVEVNVNLKTAWDLLAESGKKPPIVNILNGVTEAPISEYKQCWQLISNCMENRDHGSHLICMFDIQNEDSQNEPSKLVFLDFDGIGEGMEEAKAESFLAQIKNIIGAICPQEVGMERLYGNSKFTKMLQDAMAENSITSTLFCCSNDTTGISSLPFGTRSKQQQPMHLLTLEGHGVVEVHLNHLEKLVDRLTMKLKLEDLKLMEHILLLERILFTSNQVQVQVVKVEDEVQNCFKELNGPLRKKWHDIVWKKEYSRMKINRRSPHPMKELYVQHLERMDKCEALAARSVEELVFLYKLFPRFSGTIYYCNDSSKDEMENLVACYKARGWKLKRVRAW